MLVIDHGAGAPFGWAAMSVVDRAERELLCSVIERAWKDFLLLRRYDQIQEVRQLTKSELKRYRSIMDEGVGHPENWLRSDDCQRVCADLGIDHGLVVRAVNSVTRGFAQE